MLRYILLVALQLLPSNGNPVLQRNRPADEASPLARRSPPELSTNPSVPSENGARVSSRAEIPYPTANATDTLESTVTVTVVTTVVETGTMQVIAGPVLHGDTIGSVYTNLNMVGNNGQNPMMTNGNSEPTSTIAGDDNGILASATASMAAASDNIFASPIAKSAPPSIISQRGDHPVPRLGIQQTAPISTNKFFQNLFLGNQASGVWTHPYSLTWAAGSGETSSWGMTVSHIEASQLTFGADNSYGFADYFINPVGIQSLVMSAKELGSSTNLTTANITDMSVVAQLRASPSASPAIEFPLTQGAGFVTAVYHGSTPMIQTGVFFQNVTRVTTQPRPGVTKYIINLNDGKTWYLYATSSSGSTLNLQVVNNGLMTSNSTFSGTIQIAKVPNSASGDLYDAACGSYATGVAVSGTASGMQGTYTFTFTKGGLSGAPLLMFALPHHVSSFDSNTAAAVESSLQLRTTVKGAATAVVADSWTMVESRLPVSMSFLPWSATEGSMSELSDSAAALILKTAEAELSQDINAQTDLNSMYYSGKAFAKFAMILSVVYDMLNNTALAAAGLQKLEDAFGKFVNNTQDFPLVYDTAWGGVVSSASYGSGDSGADFGNTYYNDHHFHYGYHVLAAAIIAHLDSSWLTAHKDWVNTLVRDYANPSSLDPYFPVSRMFDWYHGHSFAHGLFASGDGRDQESSSEDVMAAYAIKMWGTVIGDGNMAARGNLMLAVQARALNDYYLYTSNNTIQPANFIGNKAAGILFENKIDHTTYFGTNIEYIQGIHMLPLLPSTPLIRGNQFVTEEWDQYFDNGYVDTVAGGWRGVLYGNLATIDPSTAYKWFSSQNSTSPYLDGGASLTWYLAFAAALGGL